MKHDRICSTIMQQVMLPYMLSWPWPHIFQTSVVFAEIVYRLIYRCTHTYIYVYILYVCITHICTHACTHICTHICVHIYFYRERKRARERNMWVVCTKHASMHCLLHFHKQPLQFSITCMCIGWPSFT